MNHEPVTGCRFPALGATAVNFGLYRSFRVWYTTAEALKVLSTRQIRETQVA